MGDISTKLLKTLICETGIREVKQSIKPEELL